MTCITSDVPLSLCLASVNASSQLALFSGEPNTMDRASVPSLRNTRKSKMAKSMKCSC